MALQVPPRVTMPAASRTASSRREAGEGARPAARVPGVGGDETDDVMDASPGDGRGVAAGGGAARIMSPLLFAPRPPFGGHARWWGPKEVWVEFLQPQRPLWHLYRRFVAGVSVIVDGDTPTHTLTHMHSRGRLLCKRVGGGVLSVLSALKLWFHQSRNPGDGPLPCRCPRFQGKMNLLSYIPTKKFCSVNPFP